jgi:hypothetical protein
MPSSNENPAKYSRRIKWLGIGVTVFIALYSGAWSLGASKIKDELGKALAQASADGKTAECAGLDVGGYPFRIEVRCGQIAFADPSQQISAKAGALRTAAQVYDPMRGIVEIDGPLELSLPGGRMISASWSLLHASARAAQPVPKRASVEAKDFSLIVPQLSAAPLLKAGNLQGHFKTAEQDIDLAASAAALLLDPSVTDGRSVPAFNFDADIRIKDGVRLALSEEKNIALLLRGRSAEVRAVSFNFAEGGGFKVSGPVSLDERGLMTADLSITFSQAQKLADAVQKISPGLAAYVSPSLSLAASTAKPGEDPEIDITIRKGKAAIGIFPLGEIPALQ